MTKFEAWIEILNIKIRYAEDKKQKNFLKYFRLLEMRRYLNFLREKEGYREIIKYE